MWNLSKISLTSFIALSCYNLGFAQNVINGTSSSEEIIGTPADDIIYAGGGVTGDYVYGRGGDDRLYGQNGIDFLYGQDGSDAYFGGPETDTVIFLDLHENTQGAIVNLNDETITNDGFGNQETMSSIEQIGAGTVFADTITGNNLDNILEAWGLGDTISGLDGDDTIKANAAGVYDGNGGRDKLILNIDTYYTLDTDNDGFWDLVQSSPNEIVDVNLETEQITNDGFGNSGQAIRFRDIEIEAPAQTVIVTGSTLGNDIFVSSDVPSVISGGGGNDLIRGSGLLNGGDGDDNIQGSGEIYGGNGIDSIYTGDGNDNIISGGAGNDDIQSGDGDDHISGNGGADYIQSEEGNDRLFGNAGNDLLKAGDGNDVLFGGAGRDWLNAQIGNDILFFDDIDTHVYGGRGYDKAIATQNSGPLTLEIPQYTSLEEPRFEDIEQVWASQFDDVLDGSQSNTFLKLFGQAGNDTIIGSPKGDRLYGELGNDTLTGNAGNDRFFFETNWGNDTITDFGTGTDRISLKSAGVVSISELSIFQDGADAMIEYSGNSIRLLGYDSSLLQRTNFIFASIAVNDSATKNDPEIERTKLLKLIE